MLLLSALNSVYKKCCGIKGYYDIIPIFVGHEPNI